MSVNFRPTDNTFMDVIRDHEDAIVEMVMLLYGGQAVTFGVGFEAVFTDKQLKTYVETYAHEHYGIVNIFVRQIQSDESPMTLDDVPSIWYEAVKAKLGESKQS